MAMDKLKRRRRSDRRREGPLTALRITPVAFAVLVVALLAIVLIVLLAS
jgi:hypothetical protein